MYNLNQIKAIHFEPTSRCQASCPMCARNFQGGIENPFLILEDISLDQFKKWFPKKFISQLDRFYMCGNVGEPILAKDTLEIFEYIRTVNPNINLGMNTNGSARTVDWWKRLAKVFDNKGYVRFGIDGLADTHKLYRIGTDWNKIIENASAFISAGGLGIWDMLVFDHNKHQIDECEKISKDIGFKEFAIKHTSRFKEEHIHVLTRSGKTSHFIYPSDRSKNFTKDFSNYKIEENRTIHCKVKQELNLFINAHGNVFPCCWLDIDALPPMSLSRVDYLDRGFQIPSLNKMSLEEIFDSQYFDLIEKTWNENPLRECSKQCGKIDKFNAQF
jgi:MoaA/NifB/PqqE/SkfB family radical SAM enzyme